VTGVDFGEEEDPEPYFIVVLSFQVKTDVFT
jgi:hypothetical protein